MSDIGGGVMLLGEWGGCHRSVSEPQRAIVTHHTQTRPKKMRGKKKYASHVGKNPTQIYKIYKSQMQIVAYTTQHVSLHVRLHCTPGLSLQPGDSIAPMHMNNMAKTKFVTRICVAYATNLAELGLNMGRICVAYATPGDS